MNAHRGQLTLSTVMVRIVAIVFVMLVGHDVMMAMEPHQPSASHHAFHTVDIEECGPTEGVAQFSPTQYEGPVPQSVSPISVWLLFDLSEVSHLSPVDTGTDSSEMRIWQQVFLN